MANEKVVKELEKGDIVLYNNVLFRIRFVAHNTADLWNKQESISAVPTTRLTYVGRDTLTMFADSPKSIWTDSRRDHRVGSPGMFPPTPVIVDEPDFFTYDPKPIVPVVRKPERVDEITTADLIRKEVQKLKTERPSEEEAPPVPMPKREGKW